MSLQYRGEVLGENKTRTKKTETERNPLIFWWLLVDMVKVTYVEGIISCSYSKVKRRLLSLLLILILCK